MLASWKAKCRCSLSHTWVYIQMSRPWPCLDLSLGSNSTRSELEQLLRQLVHPWLIISLPSASVRAACACVTDLWTVEQGLHSSHHKSSWSCVNRDMFATGMVRTDDGDGNRSPPCRLNPREGGKSCLIAPVLKLGTSTPLLSFGSEPAWPAYVCIYIYIYIYIYVHIHTYIHIYSQRSCRRGCAHRRCVTGALLNSMMYLLC